MSRLAAYQIAKLAGEAMVDPRTARAWLLGKSVSNSSRVRLVAAAEKLQMVCDLNKGAAS